MAFQPIQRMRRALVKAAVSAFGLDHWFGGIFRSSGELWPGQWQSGVVIESTENLLRFSSVYACITLISNDVAKLRPRIMRRASDEIWDEDDASPFARVLKRPNRYQTWTQFCQQWVASKLTYGNAYAYKEREQGSRGMVRALYVLDARRVLPSVASDGEVFYLVASDDLAQVSTRAALPASEIIHDRMTGIWHPLIGVSPLYASGVAATVGIRIQRNSEVFFKNMSRPSGQLIIPGNVSDEQLARFKAEYEKLFSGANIGRLMVSTGGAKFEAIDAVPAQDAQLAEQHGLSVAEVARAFHVPLHKLAAGPYPNLTSVGSLNQDYYDHALQIHITSIEQCLGAGLELPTGLKVDIDENGIMRMDPLARAEVTEKEVKAATLSPNEGRARENRHPVKGGETPYIQQQNWPINRLAELHDLELVAQPTPALPAPSPEQPEEDTTKQLADALIKRFQENPIAVPA